jgi:hypothetical protein
MCKRPNIQISRTILLLPITILLFMYAPYTEGTHSRESSSFFAEGVPVPVPGPITTSQEVDQFDLINVLTWNQVVDPYAEITGYNVYCTSDPSISCSSSDFIAKILQPLDPSESVVFRHHCRCPQQEYFYCITAINSMGNESDPVQVSVSPTLIDIPAPTYVSASQKLNQFDLINKLCWDPVNSDYYPVIGYKIYCSSNEYTDCSSCYNCSPSCCSSQCYNAILIAQIPAGAPLTFEHHFRCPGTTYDYCISAVAQTGDYTTESIIPHHVTVEPAIDPQSHCTCTNCQSLNLVNRQTHGAPVQSVAWLCNNCGSNGQCSCTDQYIIPHPTAAIGGYLSYTNACDGATIRTYALNFMNDQLVQTAHALPTSFVYSVDWCCIDGNAYLAVGGRTNETTGFDVWIYKYTFDGITGTLELIDSFAHGTTVWAVAWLNDDCNNSSSRYLAIGGDPSNNIDLRLLSFNAELKQLSLTTNRTHGATVYALDWCVRPLQNPLLLAGGKIATENYKHCNFRIYSVSCGGSMNFFSSGLYCGQTVRTAKWHCYNDAICSTLPIFAIGGDAADESCCNQSEKLANIQIYALNTLTHHVCPMVHTHQQGRVFSIDWYPNCKEPLMTAGSGCKSDCLYEANIAAYTLSMNPSKNLHCKTYSRFDDSIASLKWCTFGNCSYLLVGAEHGNSDHCSVDPFCNQQPDIALYKAKLCTDCACPTGICERRTPGSFNAE